MRADAVIDHPTFILQHLDGAAIALYPVNQLRHGKILDAAHKLSRHTAT